MPSKVYRWHVFVQLIRECGVLEKLLANPAIVAIVLEVMLSSVQSMNRFVLLVNDIDIIFGRNSWLIAFD